MRQKVKTVPERKFSRNFVVTNSSFIFPDSSLFHKSCTVCKFLEELSPPISTYEKRFDLTVFSRLCNDRRYIRSISAMRYITKLLVPFQIHFRTDKISTYLFKYFPLMCRSM